MTDLDRELRDMLATAIETYGSECDHRDDDVACSDCLAAIAVRTVAPHIYGQGRDDEAAGLPLRYEEASWQPVAADTGNGSAYTHLAKEAS